MGNSLPINKQWVYSYPKMQGGRRVSCWAKAGEGEMDGWGKKGRAVLLIAGSSSAHEGERRSIFLVNFSIEKKEGASEKGRGKGRGVGVKVRPPIQSNRQI